MTECGVQGGLSLAWMSASVQKTILNPPSNSSQWHKGSVLKSTFKFKRYALICVMCIGWRHKLVLPWHGHFQRRPGWQVKSKSGTHPKRQKNINHVTTATLTFLQHSGWCSTCSAKRTDLDSGWMRHGFHFPSLWLFGTRPVCCKDKRAETRALSLPPAGPQTVYRYYGYKALPSVHALSDEWEAKGKQPLCWQRHPETTQFTVAVVKAL